MTIPLLVLLAAMTPAAGDPGPAAPTGPAAGPGQGGDEIDDPKVARRLKRRVWVTEPAPPTALASAQMVAASPPPPVSGYSGAGPTTIVSQPVAAPGARAERNAPRLKLGYRRFTFIKPGTTNPGSSDGAAGDQPFHSLSLDLYPLSWFVRLGLSTQYGWETGKFGGGGDYFVAQSFSLGGQLPGKTFTPFFEALGGGGYMRRLQFGRTIPTAYWQLGFDVGVEVFLARYAFVSAAIGYLHPVNGFARETSFASVYVDTWSFKLGFGL